MSQRKTTAKAKTGTLYLIEALLDKRVYKHPKFGNIKQYKVKWLGYPMADCTWEPSWGIPSDIAQAYDNEGKAIVDHTPGLFSLHWLLIVRALQRSWTSLSGRLC